MCAPNESLSKTLMKTKIILDNVQILWVRDRLSGHEVIILLTTGLWTQLVNCMKQYLLSNADGLYSKTCRVTGESSSKAELFGARIVNGP